MATELLQSEADLSSPSTLTDSAYLQFVTPEWARLLGLLNLAQRAVRI